MQPHKVVSLGNHHQKLTGTDNSIHMYTAFRGTMSDADEHEIVDINLKDGKLKEYISKNHKFNWC